MHYTLLASEAMENIETNRLYHRIWHCPGRMWPISFDMRLWPHGPSMRGEFTGLDWTGL